MRYESLPAEIRQEVEEIAKRRKMYHPSRPQQRSFFLPKFPYKNQT